MNSNETLEQARTVFLEGIAHFEAGRTTEAHSAFERALALAPGRASVMLNLGVTRVHLARYAESLPLLEAVVASDPGSTEAWSALAHARFELSDWHKALVALEHAFGLGADQPGLRLEYAKCLVHVGRNDEALSAYQQLLAGDERSPETWYELGDLYRDLGRNEQAAQAYRKSLEQGAEPALVDYVLSALGVNPPMPQPPRVYVQNLFDQYAEEFEQHLVGQLGYQGHRLLVDQLPVQCPAQFERVLDLGCGTGLCGEQLRTRAGWLAGVDLSSAMVEKSRARNCFDQLQADDVHDFLSRDTGGWHLVVAADVFIYVGALERLFTLLSWRIRPGGWLAFTVESAPTGSGALLLPSLRYAHSADYIEALALPAGFVVESVRDEAIRFDQTRPVLGQYWYLRRQ